MSSQLLGYALAAIFSAHVALSMALLSADAEASASPAPVCAPSDPSDANRQQTQNRFEAQEAPLPGSQNGTTRPEAEPKTESAGSEAVKRSKFHNPEEHETPPPPVELSADYKEDCLLIAGLSAKGWESSGLEALRAVDGSMENESGRRAVEVAGHPCNLLLEFGCTHVVTKRLVRGQRACIATLYRFGKPEGAYAAYSNLRVGASTVLVRGDASSEDEDSISFLKGTRFISLTTTSREDDEAKSVLTNLANNLSALAGEPVDKPALLRQLPRLEKINGTERYYLGPIAARNHLSLPYINTLSLTRCKAAASADYQYPQPYSERLKLLIVDYGQSQLARNVFTEYSGSLKSTSKVIEDNDSTLLCKVNDSFLMCTHLGPQVAIIWGARKKYAPSFLARQLTRLDAYGGH